MNEIAVLFDLDGTLIDTETQYYNFWTSQCEKFHLDKSLYFQMKGTTLKSILERFFSENKEITKQVLKNLFYFEQNMDYTFIAGADKFINELHANGIKTAVVTSSDINKMSNVFNAHPDFTERFDTIIIADDYTHSKPDPECFLVAAKRLGVNNNRCIVFEDSLPGLEAGRNAGMKVIGLSTTIPAEKINNKADLVIPDFQNIKIEQLLRQLNF